MNDLRQVLTYCSLLLGCLVFSAGYSSVWATGVNLGGATASGSSKKPGGSGTGQDLCVGYNCTGTLAYPYSPGGEEPLEFCTNIGADNGVELLFEIPVNLNVQNLNANKRYMVDFTFFDVNLIWLVNPVQHVGATMTFGTPKESIADPNCADCYLDANLSYEAGNSTLILRIPVLSQSMNGIPSSDYKLEVDIKGTVSEEDYVLIGTGLGGPIYEWQVSQQTNGNWPTDINDLYFDYDEECEMPGNGEGNSRVSFSSISPVQTSIYPNPSSGIFHFNMNLEQTEMVEATIYDLQGRQVLQVIRETMLEAGTHHETFKLSSMPSGMYILRLRYGTETKQLKLLKQ